jgi:hypothetical protein
MTWLIETLRLVGIIVLMLLIWMLCADLGQFFHDTRLVLVP